MFGDVKRIRLSGEDYFFSVGPGKDFVLFNNQELSNEPVTGDDLLTTVITGFEKQRSQTWSSHADFFFVIADDGIYLFSWRQHMGYFCKKKSSKFIEMYLKGSIANGR